MQIPIVTQLTYYTEGKRFKFMLNLAHENDCGKLIRTVRWASRNSIDVSLRRASLQEAQEHAEEMQALNQ